MATYRRRGRRWQVEVCVQGRREGKSHATKAEALAWAQAREVALAQGAPLRTAATLHQALRRFATDVSPQRLGATWEQSRLGRFERELSNIALADVTAAMLADWRDRRLATRLKHSGRPLSPASVRRDMALLRAVFEIARRDWGWIERNPMIELRRPPAAPARRRRIGPDELERLLLALGYQAWEPPATQTQEVAVMLLLAIETGMRAGELHALTWPHVDLASRVAHLPRSKNGDARDVPLSRTAVTLLATLPRTDGLVFRVPSGNRDALFRKARARAQLVDLTFHDARHEAVTRLAQRLDVLDLARMIGHRDLRSLMIYYNATASEIAKRLD